MSFSHQNDQWYCEHVPLKAIAAEAGTPVYIYSRQMIRKRANAYLDQLTDPSDLICYATKANSSPAILQELSAMGLGADVTSGGELYLSLKAGYDPQKIIYSGVGKRDDEIAMALEAGIRALHIESTAELQAVETLAAKIPNGVSIGVRVNPNVAAETHPYISTGMHEHKFGVTIQEGWQLILAAARSPHLVPMGLAAHIGSQIEQVPPFGEAARLLTDMGTKLRAGRIMIDYIDVGGGLGINKRSWSDPNDVVHIQAWMDEVYPTVKEKSFRFTAEPGRSIVGPTGCLVTKVVFNKPRENKRFLIVDAGMNDLIRPTLYKAEHPIVSVMGARNLEIGEEGEIVDVVGPICESGDYLAKDRLLPPLERGDLLAVMNAGAYGFAMSSNYNGRLRAAEVMVDGDSWRVIRPRETYEDLWPSI
ncbi:MAG: diaminopimelate decarboxylase [Ardenticatenaceae bacterium]|nr:diaminopimelate decarboxylase [Ardenticatenaceae bacterium]